ncbi:Histone-lysine N-methyltransferase SETMAR [Habropoda laboriosa]|uniref:Histone-lysine N-methyltransferase SETMAR n=1 Tax=Habropoda laboriosa TaxID=597456 RepID=A0A0L7QWI2_9HYME|nr:Histone-lysine N-methyltransferase SETMAR [Habropoda laboriosa]
MRKMLFVKQASLVNRKGPILLHDNARPHVSQFTIRKIHESGYETLKHPPYSPDLSPTDYHFHTITAARTSHNSRFGRYTNRVKKQYSPDLSPTDYHFFKHFDNFLREKIFRNKEDAVNTFVEVIHSGTPDF